jgi:hypothetical protein
MNDSIIIGSVIVLVFGALCYYLYSRLLYSEKRVNVMENILLDLKTASETYFTSSADMPLMEESINYTTLGEPEPVDGVTEITGSSIATDDAPTPATTAPETPTTTAPETPVATSSDVSLNYESMNIKELQQEARNRNISGVSGMRRKELIEQLRKSDNGEQEESMPPSSSVTLTPFMINAGPINLV